MNDSTCSTTRWSPIGVTISNTAGLDMEIKVKIEVNWDCLLCQEDKFLSTCIIVISINCYNYPFY